MANSCQVKDWPRINFLSWLSCSESPSQVQALSRDSGKEAQQGKWWGNNGRKAKIVEILYLWSFWESYVKSDTAQKAPSLVPRRVGEAASLPTISRQGFGLISPHEVVTEAAITKGLHGYVIGYWKRAFVTKQRRRYLICLKTKAPILRESTSQSVWSPNSPNPSVLMLV